MKRLLFFLMAMIIAIQGWSQATLNEGFEGTAFPPDDWRIETTSGGGTWESSTSIAHGGTKSARSGYSSAGCTRWLITPKLTVTSAANSFSFWVATDDWYPDGDDIDIFVSTTDNSPSSFGTTSLLSLTEDSVTESWAQHTVDLSTFIGQDIYVAIRVTDNFGFNTFIDDVTGPELFVPACPKPTALSATNPTTAGVDLGWTDATGTLWNIQYMLATETDWTNSTTISGATSNPYTFTTLSPSTAYKTRVQTDCGTEQSEWSSTITFATGCDVISTLPWTEGFETSTWSPAIFPGNALAPLCWTNINKGSGTSNLWSRGTTSHTGTGAAQMYTDNSSQNNDWLISPKITLTGNERLRFWAQNYSATTSEVDEISIWISDGIITSIDTTNMGVYDSIQGFIQVFQTGIPVGAWQQYEVNLNQYSGDTYIAFVRRNTPNNGWYLRLDDIEVSTLPTCNRPTNLVVSNPTTTDATVSWVNGNSADASWWVYYKQSSASTYDSVLVNSNPYTLTTLLPSSGYSIYVATDCGTEVSEASNVVNFQTLCEAVDGLTDLPWNEGFEGITANNQLPACWSATSLGNYTFTQTANYNSYNRNARTGTKSAYFRYGANDKFVTPIFNLYAGQSYDFSFWYVSDGLSGWQNLKAGVREVNNPTATQTVGTPVTNIINSTYELYLGMFTPAADGLYEFTIECQSTSAPWYLTIDDISLSLTPNCPNVYGLTAEPASTTSVSVNWTDEGDNGDGYNIAYAANITGTFDPTLATIIPITTGTTLPYIIPGFNPGDSVWVAVQRGCLGTWTDAVKVNLPTFVNQLPLTANFEDSTLDTVWTITNGAQTNKWYIGAPGANDSDPTDANAERGLYISNDLGVSATYDNTSSSVVFLSTLVEFDNSPSFQLSFDWVSDAESCCDYINVYLLPLGMALNPGTLPSDQYKLNTTVLNNTTVFQTYTQAFNASYANTVKQLVFAWKNDGSQGDNPPARVDNISLVALTCGMPYGLAMDSASYNGTDVYLSWTEPQAATDWIVEYQQTGSSTWNQVAATTNPLTLTGLNPGTAYQARVRSICNASDTSSISNVINFQTACIALTVPTLPELFNTVLPSTCWDRKAGLLPATGPATLSSTTSGWYSNSNPMMPNAGNHAYINIWSTGANYWLITPSYDLGDGTSPAQIEFDALLSTYNASGAPSTAGVDDKFAVVVSTDNGLTWNAANAFVWSNDASATRVYNNLYPLQHIILPLMDPTTSLPYTGNVKIAFYGESTVSNAANYLHIDNFEVLPYSTCQRPTSLQANAVTSTTADISFQENGTSTTWQYVLTDGTITDPNNGTPISTIDNPILLNNLTPQTEYTIWIRSDCSTEFSIWSNELVFVTEAPPATVPYTYDFENQTEALAWRNLSGSTYNWAIGQAAGNGPSTQNTADNKATYISNDNGVSTGASGSIYAYTYRDIDFGSTPASYSLTFDWKCQGDVEGSSAYSGLIVYLRDPAEVLNPTGYPTNVNDNLGLFAQQSTWQTDQVSIDNVSGVKRLIFFYFDNYSNYAPPAAIDNISINLEACPRPFGVTDSNVTSTSADIFWSNTGADSYIVSYRTNATGSTLTHDAAASSPYTIQGLIPGNEYLVAVRAICGSDTSMYSETVLFTTPLIPEQIPYTCNFETPGNNGWLLKNGSCTNKWMVGTPTGGASNALFVSNNNAAASYDLNSFSAVIAEKLFEFNTTDSIQLSFDLSIGGESSWDYLKVFLVDKDTVFNPSTSTTYFTVNSYAPGIIMKNGTNNYINLLSGTQTLSTTFASPGIGVQMKLVFVWKNDNSGGNGNSSIIDNINITTSNPNPCPPPTNVVVAPSNITATVSWSAGAESAWEVRLGTTGTPVAVSTPNYTIPSLSPGTPYTVYVRSNCGTGYSSWVSAPFTTTTAPTPPSVSTTVPTAQIAQFTATFNGTYVQGTDPVTAIGFEYKTTAATTWTDQPVTPVASPFTYQATTLTSNTSYKVRAYVVTATEGRVFGDTITFSTLAIIPPTVTTDSVRNVTQTSATFYGTITANTEQIEARGFEYKLSTEAWSNAIIISATGVTNIYASPTTLQDGRTYNVRAYGRTLSDTSYGQILTFSTLTAPTVTTTPTQAADVQSTTATLKGTVTSAGNALPSQVAVGFVYSTTTNPVIGATGVLQAEATYSTTDPNFTTQITQLVANTNYFVKAYITNPVTTAYGNEVNFTTLGLLGVDGKEISIMMYPNPATSQTNLIVEGVSGETKIVLSDVQGRILSTINTKAVNGVVEQTIDLNNLAKGVYYIRIQNSYINRTQKLIVK